MFGPQPQLLACSKFYYAACDLQGNPVDYRKGMEFFTRMETQEEADARYARELEVGELEGEYEYYDDGDEND